MRRLLNPAEQALLRALAGCVGGWTIELAAALVGPTMGMSEQRTHNSTARSVAELLGALVDQAQPAVWRYTIDNRHNDHWKGQKRRQSIRYRLMRVPVCAFLAVHNHVPAMVQ